MAARMALMPQAYFIAHVLYGFGLATTPMLIRAFTKEDRRRDIGHAAETQPIWIPRSQ